MQMPMTSPRSVSSRAFTCVQHQGLPSAAHCPLLLQRCKTKKTGVFPPKMSVVYISTAFVCRPYAHVSTHEKKRGTSTTRRHCGFEAERWLVMPSSLRRKASVLTTCVAATQKPHMTIQ